METYYLIDYENVHDEGTNTESMTKDDHVHIFFTKNDKVKQSIFESSGDIQLYLVPDGKQSVDMHLVSYLGHLLGIHGRQCNYVIISKDKDYDNIVKFWKNKGYSNISRKGKLPGGTPSQKRETQTQSNTQNVNNRISSGMAYKFSGKDRSDLNVFVQRGLVNMGYLHNDANKICKLVVARCNDTKILFGIHNDLKREFDNYSKVYEDVKSILERFVASKSKPPKRESQVRSFFGQHFKKKLYADHKEEIIQLILNAKTRQQVNNGLLKIYSDGNVVSHIYQTVQPLIKDLPGK